MLVKVSGSALLKSRSFESRVLNLPEKLAGALHLPKQVSTLTTLAPHCGHPPGLEIGKTGKSFWTHSLLGGVQPLGFFACAGCHRQMYLEPKKGICQMPMHSICFSMPVDTRDST
eukprot:1188766-Prorocentrum_minimum.AAC.5